MQQKPNPKKLSIRVISSRTISPYCGVAYYASQIIIPRLKGDHRKKLKHELMSRCRKFAYASILRKKCIKSNTNNRE